MPKARKFINEEIARSRQTTDNDPFHYSDHDDVKVEMHANDRGKWTVRVDCLSNPSLSCATQAFDMEAEAESYARSCSDRIMRHTMNERYSLMNHMYPDRLVMTEGLLDWFFGLMGKFVNVFFGQAGETEQNVTSVLNPSTEDKSIFGKWADKILGKRPDVKSAKDLDMSDEKNRKVFMSCVCDDSNGNWKKSLGEFQSHFQNLLKIEQWFPPEDEEEAKKWGEGPGKVISEGLYGYLGYQGGTLKYIGETLGGDAKTAGDAYEKIKKDKETMGSALKTAQFIQDKMNPQLAKIYKYSSEKLEIEGATTPMQLVTLGNQMLEKLIPIVEKASKEKADKDFEGDLSGELDGMDVDGEEEDKKKTEARVRRLVSNILLEIHS